MSSKEFIIRQIAMQEKEEYFGMKDISETEDELVSYANTFLLFLNTTVNLKVKSLYSLVNFSH